MPRSRNSNVHLIEESDDNYVVTPLGEGLLIGKSGERVTGEKGVVTIIDGYMVRLPVDDITRPHLSDQNCTTKHAQISGIWIFTAKVMNELNPKHPKLK
jgi:hypothetical protein